MVGLQELINHGTDLEAHHSSGFTALLWAVRQGHANCTELLLERGAYTGAADNSGHTALHWAAYTGHSFCYQLQPSRQNCSLRSWLQNLMHTPAQATVEAPVLEPSKPAGSIESRSLLHTPLLTQMFRRMC